MTPTREAFLVAGESAAALLADPAVAAAWDAPSALADLTVRGLAGHLANQVLFVPLILAEPAPEGEPVSLLGHYSRVSWIGAALDDDINVGIRASGEDAAAGGPEVLAAEVGSALHALRGTLATQPADRVVHPPAGPWPMNLDDLLVTRMMEIAVHSDDLACSVQVDTPPLPPSVLGPVFALLTDLAIRRHGPTALLRALSRAERAPATIAAF
jgi:hypothetical protein